MFKRKYLLFVLLCICMIFGVCENVCAASKVHPSIKGKHAIIMDADTGKIIYKKNAYSKCHNASTTKLMTAVVALEENKNLNKKIKISKYASSTIGVSINSRAGEKYYLKDMVNAMLIRSACDCAIAVAEGTCGNEKKFVKKMNKKCKEIGCKHTMFSTASGLRNGNAHYTTSYDLALITRYAYANKTIRKILSKKSYSFKSVSGRKCCVKNTNELLKSKKYKCVGKTGTGETAKYCFTGVYTYKKHTYVFNVLGSTNEEERWNDARKLIDACISYTDNLK